MTNEKTSEQTSETPPPRKASGKKVLFLALGLLLLAGGGAIGWHFLSHKVKADGPALAPPLTIVPLDKFIVNLADTDREAYLKVGIDLGVSGPLKKGADGKNSIPTPKIRDAILSVLTIYHSADLLTPEGKTKLKQNLIEVLKQRVPQLGVRRVYFTDFLVQR